MNGVLKALVVDDSQTICRYLVRILSRKGYQVLAAYDGMSGLQLWRQTSFDVIFLDLLLPDLDGLSVLKQIRAQDQTTCIIVLTGHSDVRNAIEAVRQGADGYVEKQQIATDADLEEFLHTIQRAIDIRKAQAGQLQLQEELRQKNKELEETIKQLQQARNELQEEQKRLKQILFSLSELVIVVDTEGRIVLINPSAEKELGISPDKATGCSLAELGIHEKVLEGIRQVIETKDTLQLEIPSLKSPSSDSDRIFRATLNPVRLDDGSLLGVVIVLHDITQEKEFEQMKADFYSMIIHDLRSPATAIIGFADLLAQEAVGPLTPSQKEIVEIIQRSVHKLLNLINDFLDYSAIDAGFLRLDRKETDLRELILEVVREMRPMAYQRQQTLDVQIPSEPVIAWVDGERLNQVVTNLLSNAIKYTPEGGHIRVRLQSTPEHIIIEVSDNGIGIREEQIPLLFSKYKRISNDRTRQIQGTGLGLLIVKEIVKAHGGEITVESEVGKGSTFRVVLPRVHAQAPAQGAQPPDRCEEESGEEQEEAMEEEFQAAAS